MVSAELAGAISRAGKSDDNDPNLDCVATDPYLPPLPSRRNNTTFTEMWDRNQNNSGIKLPTE